MGALAQAVSSGKALYAGISNYDGPTMEKAAQILSDLRCPFIINQPEQLLENIQAMRRTEFSAEELRRIDAVSIRK